MKKFAALMAGVAAIATAGAASADTIYQGSFNVAGTGNVSGNVQGNFGEYLGALALQGVDIASNWGVLNNTSVIVISGSSQGNNGQASITDGATFTLKGNVTKDCAYYTGNADTTVDFGTLGIYASDNTGPAAAFDMVAPANVSIDTNLAGCNTANSVTITKSSTDGLRNLANAGGYDDGVFQANLPYNVTANYKAGPQGSVGGATQANHIVVGNAALTGTATHGAWKSPMSIDVNIPVPSKSLLAGNYEGTLNVELRAF